MKTSKIFRLRTNCAVAVALAANVLVGHAGPLGQGLTPKAFTLEFNSGAAFDNETTLVLTGCEQRPIPARHSASFSCTLADGYVSGYAERGSLRHVTLIIPAIEQSSVHSFQRSGKYFVNAVQGDRRSVPSSLRFVVELMQEAMKKPDRTKSAEISGIRYTFAKEVEPSGTPVWTLAAEPAAPTSR